MLQFLHGWLWLFGAAAALPIVLHLLSRQRLRKVPFSSLMLISRLEKSQMRRLRLRQLLLLILRTLAILFLVAAFTRPLIHGEQSGVLGGEETAAVIVVDRSASMSALGDAGRRSDLARAFSHQIVGALARGDRLALMPDTGGTGEVHFLHTPEAWGAALDSALASDGRARLGAAVEAAYRVLDTVAAGSKELYVVTDGQASSWQVVPTRRPEGVRTYLAAVEDKMQPDRGLRRLDFGASLWVAHAPLEVSVLVSNHGADVRDLPVSLFLDGGRVAQAAVSVADGDSVTVPLSVSDLAPGWHYGRVEISADAWPADNRLFFALDAAPSLPVLVVGDNREVVRPVAAALRPKPETRTPFAPEVVSPAALADAVDPKFGLVVLAGVNSLPKSAWDRLLGYVQNGGGLWVLMDPDNDAANYDANLLKPLWNTSLKARVLARPGGSFITLTRPLRHAMFSYLEHAQEYPEIRFGGSAKLGPVDRDAVLQRFSDGSAAVIEAVHGAGRVVLFTGYAGPQQSDLVYHPLFVPQVQATATYLARRGSVGTRAFVDVGTRPDGPADATGNWSWVTPDADTLLLPGGPLLLPAMTNAGIYRLLRDGGVAAYYAANIDSAEFDLAPVDDWDEIWGEIPYARLDGGSSVAAQITEARVGIDLWRPALIFALLLLIAEMAVAWPRPSERT